MKKKYHIDRVIDRKLAGYPKTVKCPFCPASIVVYDEEEEAAVKRDGCGVKGCPGREK